MWTHPDPVGQLPDRPGRQTAWEGRSLIGSRNLAVPRDLSPPQSDPEDLNGSETEATKGLAGGEGRSHGMTGVIVEHQKSGMTGYLHAA